MGVRASEKGVNHSIYLKTEYKNFECRSVWTQSIFTIRESIKLVFYGGKMASMVFAYIESMVFHMLQSPYKDYSLKPLNQPGTLNFKLCCVIRTQKFCGCSGSHPFRFTDVILICINLKALARKKTVTAVQYMYFKTFYLT